MWWLEGDEYRYRLFDDQWSMADKCQSLHIDREKFLWIGGHATLTREDSRTLARQTIRIKGEVKTMANGNDRTVYGAVYPSTQVFAVDAAMEPRTITTIPGQYRPREIAYDAARHQLLVASGPHIGHNQGALSFVDIATGAIEVRTDILVDQVVFGLSVVGDIAYVCGDRYGEQKGPVKAGAPAEVAAVHIPSRSVLWRIAPSPTWWSITDVHAQGRYLYLVARRPRGEWLAIDLDTREVAMSGAISGDAQVRSHCGRVFASCLWADSIHELPTKPGRAQRDIWHEIPPGWYNLPQFAFVPGKLQTYGIWDRKLALFDLS